METELYCFNFRKKNGINVHSDKPGNLYNLDVNLYHKLMKKIKTYRLAGQNVLKATNLIILWKTII